MENIRVATLLQIVYLRKKANLSQVEMAEKMEISQNHYARFEIGKSKTDLYDLSNFCKCLNLSLREFFEFSDSLHLCKEEKADITIKLIDGSKEEFIRIITNSNRIIKLET